MQVDEIVVDTGALRGGAAALDDTSYRLGHGLLAVPGLTVAEAGWEAATALVALEAAIHGFLAATGKRTAELSAALRTAADAYEAADHRSGRRLAGHAYPGRIS
ncbi:MAG TPA: type VII secretion target [Micromonosporaceae bacterium]